MSSVIYLQNKYIKINGLKIYGSPFTPTFNNWAFMRERFSIELKDIWKNIPHDLDFLITHGPPYGILDRNLDDIRCGCEILMREIIQKPPKYHIFGHIHNFGGKNLMQNKTMFINCGQANEYYDIKNNPIIFNI